MRIDPSRAIGGYAAVATLALAWMALASAAAPRPSIIDAERINIREPDGTLRLVITDGAHQPGIVLGKRVIPHPSRVDAGMIFYNRQGIENGGLVFDGTNAGGRPTNGGSLTFDRYLQDQTLQLISEEDEADHIAGLRVIDRPDQPMDFDAAFAAARMPKGPARDAAVVAAHANPTPRGFFGRDTDGTASMLLRDGEGHARLRISVARQGAGRIEFLDAAGKVTRTVAGE